ncbi:MAG TPA: PepSY domain-containing protein, partial [Phycisphaerales bacterium]|nr:PepSY domain-containing protein [Phycisphaerales bacterium]
IGPDGASFRDPRAKSIAVDPVTLDVLGEVVGGRSLLTGIMHDIHSHALIPGGIGRPIVGWLGVIMLFLCGSGLIIWWTLRLIDLSLPSQNGSHTVSHNRSYRTHCSRSGAGRHSPGRCMSRPHRTTNRLGLSCHLTNWQSDGRHR